MARAKVKTEMKGTGGGRWTTREDAKRSADRRRREIDRAECEAGERELREDADGRAGLPPDRVAEGGGGAMLEFEDVPEVDREWLEGRMAEAEGGEEWEFQDNFRLARAGNAPEEEAYEDARREGCCGSADFEFPGSPSGATYLWGFNYGH